METLNKFDQIEKIIFRLGLRITSIEIRQKENTMNIFLNTGVCFPIQISDHKLLALGTLEQLENYELIADGVGIHWPDLDEDLSLKGFIRTQYELYENA